jgi:transcriptional regulator with XRE-family HTH domain
MRKKAVNAALRREMKRSGLSRARLADAADLYPAHLDAIEEKGTVPGLVSLDSLLRALGLRLVVGDPEGNDLEM